MGATVVAVGEPRPHGIGTEDLAEAVQQRVAVVAVVVGAQTRLWCGVLSRRR